MPDSISELPMRQTAEGDEALERLYREIVSMGFGDDAPIHWFTAQSERPDLLQATWTLTRSLLVHGQLPPTLKQMIAMAISIQNRCRYCAVVHTGALQAMGIPDQVIEGCAGDPDLAQIPPPHRAVLRFALKAAGNANAIDASDYRSLRDSGLADGEIVEVILMAAFTNFINTWADAAGIPLDGGE